MRGQRLLKIYKKIYFIKIYERVAVAENIFHDLTKHIIAVINLWRYFRKKTECIEISEILDLGRRRRPRKKRGMGVEAC